VRVFVSLADRSAANYAYHLFKEGFEDFTFVGLTDERLERLGFESLGGYEQLSAVGFTEALTRLPAFLKLRRRLLEEALKSDAVLLCDAPALNLYLLKELKKLGAKKVFYFIPPQVWAWREKRAELVKKADAVITLLPFEFKLFKSLGARVYYEGHPLVDLVKPTGKLRPPPGTVGLLPGSREGELKRHLPLLKEVTRRLKRPFVVPTLPPFTERVKQALPKALVLSYDGASYDVFYGAEFSLIASGTASLEAGLAGHPHAVFYRVSPITYFLARRLVKVPFVSLVNLLLNRPVVPELLQKGPDELVRALEEVDRSAVKEELKELKELLGPPGVLGRLRELFRELFLRG